MAIFGADSDVVALDTAMSGYDAQTGLLILVASTLVLIFVSVGIFKLGDYVARRKGLIDMTTAY
jgi:hypothetical protein